MVEICGGVPKVFIGSAAFICCHEDKQKCYYIAMEETNKWLADYLPKITKDPFCSFMEESKLDTLVNRALVTKSTNITRKEIQNSGDQRHMVE